MKSKLKKNKLIAKFMGEKLSDSAHTQSWFDEQWKYDSDWNRLMPVIEKLEEDYDLDFNIMQIGCVVYGNSSEDICTTHGEKKIDFVFDAVVYVIEMINKELL